MSNLQSVGDESRFTDPARTGQSVPVLRALYFFYFASFGIIVTFLNVYYRDLGLTGVQIGLLSSVTPLVSIVAAPLWGIWSDKMGRVRYLLIIACVGIIAAISGISLAKAFLLLVLFTMLHAFFDSSVLPIIDSTTLRALGKDSDRFGRERVWGSVGFILATLGIGYILERFGYRWFFVFYILTIVGVAVVVNWLPNKKVDYKPAVYTSILKLIVKREWLIFSASLLMLGLGNFATNGFLGIYIKDLGGNEGLMGTAAALATFTELPIMFFGDKILKRFGPWKLLLVAFGAIGLRLFLYGVMPVAGWVIPISLLNSLTFGVYWIATVAYVDQMASDEIKSSAQGILYAVLNVSRMLSAVICGYLYDLVGGGNLFLISSFFSILSIVLLWFNNPANKKQVAGNLPG